MNDGDATDMQSALDWLEAIVAGSLAVHTGAAEAFEPGPLGSVSDQSWLARFIAKHRPGWQEFVVLMLAVAPHLKPEFLDALLARALPEGGELPQFGGVKGGNHRGILPTGETAQFVLAGDELAKRMAVARILSADHWFAKARILWLDPVREGEPAMSGRLVVDPEIVEEITTGKVVPPRFSPHFPAEPIETGMDWEDLILHPDTRAQIREIEHWIAHSPVLLDDWGMRARIRPGYRALFHGPPGTGKTLTATLLGKQSGRPVFRVDLSRTVSKYIGETEKNLASLLDKAESKDWILFFDEADALFGKRTEVRDAHDKYGNQQVAYLLQRIESHDGIVILSSNQRANIDDAFVRRLQAIVPFPMPRPEERLALWRGALPPQMALADDIDWHEVAARHELSGAAILNIIQFCAIDTLARGGALLDPGALDAAIRREYVKEGRIV